LITVGTVFTAGPQGQKAFRRNGGRWKLPLFWTVIAIAQVPIGQIDVFITAVIKLYPVLVVTVYVGNDTLSRRHIFVDNHPDALCFGLFGCFSCDFCGMTRPNP